MIIRGVGKENWYRDHISFERPILAAYIKGIEDQIVKSKADFAASIKEIGVIDMPEIDLYQPVRGRDGLDDTTYDLDGVFTEYFPQLQRQSGLITLYSFLEAELVGLCRMIDHTFVLPGGRISIIAKCLKYLNSQGSLNIDLNGPTWTMIDNGIRVVRNCIIHSQAKMQKANDIVTVQAHIVATNSGNELIVEKNNRIILNSGYLEFVLGSFDRLFDEINVQLQAQKLAKKGVS